MSKGVCVVRCKKCIATDLSAIVIPDLNLKRSEGDGVTTTLKLRVWHRGRRHLCFMEPEISLIGWEGRAGEDILIGPDSEYTAVAPCQSQGSHI